jgi:hypothetical protein
MALQQDPRDCPAPAAVVALMVEEQRRPADTPMMAIASKSGVQCRGLKPSARTLPVRVPER